MSTDTLDDCEQMITRVNLSITLDLPSLLEFYKVINVKALSKRLGMNQSLLSQYIQTLNKAR
jgi:predicted transcriptional regulator